MFQLIKDLIYGLIIGSLMLVPGVSGGTTALILGIYGDVVSAVSSFRKNIKSNFLFLLFLAIGGGIGVILLSGPLKKLIDIWYAPMYCLFIGLTAGSIPMLLEKSTIKNLTKDSFKNILKFILFMIAGIAVVVIVELLPQGFLDFSEISGIKSYLLLFILGILFSVGFVLPGISLSYLMVVFGVYDLLLLSLHHFDLSFLFPMALGLAVGTIFVTKVLEKCLNQRPLPTYSMIIGFVLASDVFILIKDIIPTLPWTDSWFNYPACILMFFVGFVAIWIYTRLGLKKE